LTHWQEFLTQQPGLTRIPVPHLEIDTELSLSVNVNAALHYILHASARA
jgi:hypothetical protein